MEQHQAYLSASTLRQMRQSSGSPLLEAGLAANTIDAYGHALEDYLAFSAHQASCRNPTTAIILLTMSAI
jgi:hypothetical protein